MFKTLQGVLFLELKLYLSYINLHYENLDYQICTTILKNHEQNTLDVITDENSSGGIKIRTILHTFSTIREVIGISYKLNSNLAVINLKFRQPFTEKIGICSVISLLLFSLFFPF